MQPLTKIRIFRLRLAVAVLALYWLVIFAGTHLPAADLVDVSVNDKIKHFAAFFGLTLLWCYVTNGPIIGRILVIGPLVMLYAALDEWTQGFVPGRQPDVWDFLADLAGMATAMTLYTVARRCFRGPDGWRAARLRHSS